MPHGPGVFIFFSSPQAAGHGVLSQRKRYVGVWREQSLDVSTHSLPQSGPRIGSINTEESPVAVPLALQWRLSGLIRFFYFYVASDAVIGPENM